jgi:hypothetical protein
MVRGRRNRPLQETAIVLITTSEAQLGLGLHKHLTQVDVGSVWVIREILNHRNDESELSLAAGPVGCSGIWVAAGVAEGVKPG